MAGAAVEAYFADAGEALYSCPETGEAWLVPVSDVEVVPEPRDSDDDEAWRNPGPLDDLSWLGPTTH